jgi:hypothetical protein
MKWLTVLVVAIAIAASILAVLLYATGRTDGASPLFGAIEHASCKFDTVRRTFSKAKLDVHPA